MLRKFKSLFVIEEGAARKTTDSTDSSGPDRSSSPSVPRTVSMAPGSSGKGQIQDRFLDALFSALESNNQEGFDYMEFKDFLRSLANVPMDDATRYKSAFATAQTMGATREKIISSANHYISVLNQEQRKFDEALTGQKERNLTGKQLEIKNLEETIKSKESEIERLKADIEKHRKEIGALEEEINSASEKLTQTAEDFGATYHALLSQIREDIEKIESHL